MSPAVESNLPTAPVPDASHDLGTGASVKKRSIQHPKVVGKDDSHFTRIVDKASYLWAGLEGNAYDEVVNAILNQWTESEPSDKKFLETAIDLLVEFQNRPMKNMKDSLEWSEHVKKSGINLKRYLAWVDDQYERLAREKGKDFDEITLEMFSRSLITADWKEANDESAIVNAYLLNTEPSLKPDIYLGPLGKLLLAVRVNGECLGPQHTDSHTADIHDVTAINPHVLLEMRYESLIPGDESRQTMLFIPIGNVFSTIRERSQLDEESFAKANWQDTGIFLVLRIQSAKGTPCGLYMIRHLNLRNSKAGQEDEALWDRLQEGTPFTLAEMEIMDHQDLKPCQRITERPTLRLKHLSVSELEIVQTGEKGDWSDGVLPVGLYTQPIEKTWRRTARR